jgi:hypothetical protein
MFPPTPFYPKESNHALVIFDLRILGISERFSRERGAWGECADVEMLDLNHAVLVIRPNGALYLDVTEKGSEHG